jgi:hypothetical protein
MFTFAEEGLIVGGDENVGEELVGATQEATDSEVYSSNPHK